MTRYLILGPASMGIFAQVGALKRIESTLEDVEAISGSSAGAIIGLMLSVGMSVDKITEVAIDLEMHNFVNVSLGTFFRKYGFVDTDAIRAQFVKILRGRDPTFAELDKRFYVSAFCLNDGRTEYFSKDTHPDMHVVDAVIASMSIPVVFSRKILNGRTYVDGATVELVPMAPFYDKRDEDITAVCIKMCRTYTETIDNPRQYFECLVRASLANRISSVPRECKLVEIDVGEANIFDFNMKYEDKIRLYNIGYDTLKE